MVEHKHASVLRAIADGVPMDEFEILRDGWEGWESLKDFGSWTYCPDDWEIRRKPQHIIVNGEKFYVGADGLAEATAFITRLFMEAGYGQST